MKTTRRLRSSRWIIPPAIICLLAAGFSSIFLIGVTEALAAVPFSSSAADEQQAQLVRNQLGYLPDNFVCISAWTNDDNHDKEPVAIQCYPLNGGAKRRRQRAATKTTHTPLLGTPFPTMFWLTSPSISKAIGGLEREGYIQVFEERLLSSTSSLAAQRLIQCHQEQAQMRWQSLSDDDRALLCSEDPPSVPRMRNMLQYSGIAGTNFTTTAVDNNNNNNNNIPSIKCLHTHYAHYRSTRNMKDVTQNPVGEMIHEQLQLQFPELQL